MKITLIFLSACSVFSNCSMLFCTVTSSAVVGSSAISSAGRQLMAIAIITLCFWPPLISWGYR